MVKIPLSEPFGVFIEKAIKDSKCIVVLWSKYSITSKWVRKETQYGEKNENLVSVLIDDVEIPLQFIDIQAAKILDWSGITTPEEFDRVVKKVEKIIDHKPITPIPKPKIEKSRVITQKIESLIKDAESLRDWVNSKKDFKLFSISRATLSSGELSPDVSRVLQFFVETIETINYFYSDDSEVYQDVKKRWSSLTNKFDEFGELLVGKANLWSMFQFAIVESTDEKSHDWIHEKAKRASSEHLALLIARLQKNLYYE
ncbi:MAG: toll/interleukin-1 receptor domain-containing protein [Desulfobacterales bacterium]|nr:toll/interleukin-1 receptor domain-containing protein [Desulfobacterales bacterium]